MDNSPYYHNTAIMNHYLNYYIPPGISMTGYYPGNYGNSLGPVNTIGYCPAAGNHWNSAAFQRYLRYQNPQRSQTTSSLIFYDPRTVSGKKMTKCTFFFIKMMSTLRLLFEHIDCVGYMHEF